MNEWKKDALGFQVEHTNNSKRNNLAAVKEKVLGWSVGMA